MNNEPLSYVSSNKYLGMIVYDKLDDEEDIMRHVKRLYATRNMLISRFRKCSDEVKSKPFKSFFSNAYGSHPWCSYRQSIYKKSVVAFIVNCLVLGGVSISAIYVNNNIDQFGVLLRKSIFSFRTRLYEFDKRTLV